MVGHMKNYLNIPEWLLKEHIFHELFKFPLLDTFLASCQPRAPLYSLSFIFFVGSLEFFFCLIRTVSATVPYSYWKNDIHWLILTVSDLSPPAINLYISEKTNPRSDVLLSQFRRGSWRARDRARGYNLHFIKANFTLNISSGSLSHFLSPREK